MNTTSNDKAGLDESLPAPRATFSCRQEWLFGFLLVLAVIAAYLPVWHATFIWDDAAHLTENPVIVGPLGLKEIWTTRAARICPLTLTTFWVEHALWGLRPLPYHLVNVLLHAASALLLCRVLRRLGMAAVPAWLGAALWALHPVQVETVSWITELKNTQSGFFFLLTILFFLKWLGNNSEKENSGGWRLYILALLCGAMAMASKSSTVVLPIVLGLCAWWMDGKWKWRNLFILAPYFLMTLIASGISIWTQRLEGTGNAEWALSSLQRLVLVGKVIWFYPGKLLWPHPLMLIYPQWKIIPGQFVSWLPTVAAAAVFFFLWWNRRTGLRPFFFAYAYFLAALLPVLGLVDHTFLVFSFVGDHFQYLASMGPLALAAVGLTRLANFFGTKASWCCAGLLLILGALSWQHAKVYQDPETLWADTLQKNPDCEIACVDMASILLRKGDEAGAIAYYERTLQFKPDSMAAHNNLAWIFATSQQASLRNPSRALELAKEAEQLSHGNNAMVLRTLAAAQAGLGQFSDAQATAQKAVALADSQGKTNVAQQIQGDLDRYTAAGTIVMVRD